MNKPKQLNKTGANPVPPWNTGDIDPKLFEQVKKEHQEKEARAAPGFPIIWQDEEA